MRRPKKTAARQKVRANPYRECNGHLRYDFCYESMMEIVRKSCGQKSISVLLFSTLIVQAFGNTLDQRRSIDDYYKRQLKRLERHLSLIPRP